MKKSGYLKIYGILLLIFITVVAVFYFAAGEQLYFRQSRGTIEGILPDNIVGEVTVDVTVEQYFMADFDHLDRIGVMLSNSDRQISGDVNLTLYNASSGAVLAQAHFSPEEIGLNEYRYIELDNSVSGPRKGQLRLVITSDSGTAGDAVVLISNLKADDEGRSLYLNGSLIPGTLCFTAEGRDDVWTGSHYPAIAAAAWVMFSLVFIYSAWRYEKGKRDLLFTTAAAFKKYSFLINQLVARDFKVRYKRSFLGVLWSLLNPLLTMSVQYIVFSQLFKADIDNFPIYMLTGLVVFNFFTEAVGLSLGAIVWNANLITKVYVPKYMYPVTKVLSSTINFLLSMIPILIGMALTGETFTKALLLLPFLIICVIVFTMGLSMLLSALMVFFRDIQFLWGIISMLWMYLTALFYPASIIPENLRWVLDGNPMYCYVTFARTIFMDGVSPEPRTYVACVLYAAISLLIGSIVFKRLQDQFVLNL